jgi:hypothetical protein
MPGNRDGLGDFSREPKLELDFSELISHIIAVIPFENLLAAY